MTEKKKNPKFKTYTPNYPKWIESPIVQASFVAVQLWPDLAHKGKDGNPVASGKVGNRVTAKWSQKVKGRRHVLAGGETVRRYWQFTPEELERLEEIRKEFYPHLKPE